MFLHGGAKLVMEDEAAFRIFGRFPQGIAAPIKPMLSGNHDFPSPSLVGVFLSIYDYLQKEMNYKMSSLNGYLVHFWAGSISGGYEWRHCSDF